MRGRGNHSSKMTQAQRHSPWAASAGGPVRGGRSGRHPRTVGPVATLVSRETSLAAGGIRLERLQGCVDSSQHSPQKVSGAPLQPKSAVPLGFELVRKGYCGQKHGLWRRSAALASDLNELGADHLGKTTQIVFGYRAHDSIVLPGDA